MSPGDHYAGDHYAVAIFQLRDEVEGRMPSCISAESHCL